MSDYCHFTLDDMDETRIVILGKSGCGKSSLANTILGENAFKIGHAVNPETSECKSETRRVDGRDVTLIDTPGLFDTDRPEEVLRAEIVRCITECSPGPHAFIIVLNVGRFTDQEQAVIDKIIQFFSVKAFKFATVLFTHGDQLQEGQTIEDFLQNNQPVSDLMKKCGGRCHVIDNKYWKNNQQDENRSNQVQVKQLLKTIDHMMKANKGRFYTNKMLEIAEKMRKEEEEKIRKSRGNMTEAEIRKEAKKRAFKRLMIELAGVTTGVLLGGLFGGILVFGGEVLVGSLMVAGALAAAIKRGYDAFDDTYNLSEKAKRAGGAVVNKVNSVFNDQGKKAEDESKPLMAPDSQNVSLKMSNLPG